MLDRVWKIISAFGFLALFAFQNANSQGRPLFETAILPQTYLGYPEVWAVTSDPLGRVFVGTQSGVSYFNGNAWSLITTESNTTVRSLDFGFDGKVYVGLQGDVGYLKPDSSGYLKFVSIREFADNLDTDFKDVWATHAANKGVYFQTSDRILFWDGKTITTFSSQNGIHTSFLIDDELVIREKGKGLAKLISGKFSLIEGGSTFANMRVFFLQKIDDLLLVGTRDDGFYKISNGIVSQFLTEVDNVLKDSWLYGGIKITEKVFALNTLGSGVIFIDSEGRMINTVVEKTENYDKHITSLHLAPDNSLWVGKKNDGLLRVSLPFPLTVFDKHSGLDGIINQITEDEPRKIVSTGSGLYLETNFEEQSGGRFNKVDDLMNSWAVIRDVDSGSLLIATDGGGIAILKSGQKKTIISKLTYSVAKGHKNSGEYLFGTIDGIALVKFDGGHPFVADSLNLGQEIRAIHYDQLLNEYWLTTKRHGIYRLRRSESNLSSSKISHYSVDLGAVASSLVSGMIAGDFSYVIGTKLFKYDEASNEFILWFDSNRSKYGVFPIQAFFFDEFDRLWIKGDGKLLQGEISSDGSLILSSVVTSILPGESTSINVDNQGIVWISHGTKLLRYDSELDHQSSDKFLISLSQVTNTLTGQAHFSGIYWSDDLGVSVNQPKQMISEWQYIDRGISFQISVMSFVNPEAVQYRYKLDGTGKDWSEWDFESTRVFSTLTEGDYVFRAQAKDEVGRISEEVVYAFSILPPWYRTKWAYLGYLILIAGAVISAQKYLLMRRAHKEAKEQAVELERNREVLKKLQEANDELTKANKLKDEFLATTSHELRTPLTAILGFTSVLKEEIPEDAEYREFLNIIEDSGTRLMDTLNSLLDLAKLRSGIMEINLEDLDVFEECSKVASNFQELAWAKGVKLEVVIPEVRLMVTSDSYALGKIVHNLLSNAVKFTKEGEIEIKFRDSGDLITMTVRDTGIGIEAQFLPDLFDAFVQESDGLSRSHEGTGLGLAICSGLVSLMDSASIRVESTKGEGTTFIVELPKAVVTSNKRLRLSSPGFGTTA